MSPSSVQGVVSQTHNIHLWIKESWRNNLT